MKLKVFKIFLLAFSIFLIGTFIYGQSSNMELGPLGGFLFYNISGTNYERDFIKWDTTVITWTASVTNKAEYRNTISATFPSTSYVASFPQGTTGLLTVHTTALYPIGAVLSTDSTSNSTMSITTRGTFAASILVFPPIGATTIGTSTVGASILLFPHSYGDGATYETSFSFKNNGTTSCQVHIFFEDDSGNITDQYIDPPIAAGATVTWLASDYDPSAYDKIFMIAVDDAGDPIHYNCLTGWATVTEPGVSYIYNAIEIKSLKTVVYDPADPYVTVNFDGIDYDQFPTGFSGKCISVTDNAVQKFTVARFIMDFAGTAELLTEVHGEVTKNIFKYGTEAAGSGIVRETEIKADILYSYNVQKYGITHTITAFADYSGTVAGTVLVTSATHNLPDGTSTVIITGTTNYNGTFTATKVGANTFYITDTWVSDDATGTFRTDSDYERMYGKWDSNIFKIGTEKSGSGTLRNLSITAPTVDLGSSNLTITGSIADTTNRVTKGWFTNLEITNSPTVNGTVISAIYAPIASPTFTGIVTNPIIIFNQQSAPAAAVNVVKVWAQDYAAGDTRLYFQSESGNPIISGKNEIQFYNTADITTNYERAYFKWDSNVFKIGTEAGGGGVVRNIQIGGSEVIVPVGGSIQAAINYAVTQTPSATNLWTVVISPGVYTEAITMSPYVNLIGGGTRGSVVIFQNAADVITLADHVEVQNLTVRTGTTGDIHTFIDGGVACTAKISDVDLESTYTGVGGWGGLYITGAGDYTLDRIYIRNTATAGGTGDQGFVLINGVAATARITNCNIYMEGAPGGTSSKSILGIIAPAAATIISSGNRYDGDAFCNTFYAESGTIISTNDSILTQYGDQIDPSASVTAGNQKFINTVANGLVATIMTNLGPTGAQTTIQGWIQIKDLGGTTRYIPYW